MYGAGTEARAACRGGDFLQENTTRTLAVATRIDALTRG